MQEFVAFDWWLFFVRWCHIASGVMWIGHLWYFNFTQTPTMPKIPTELRPGVALILAWMNGYLLSSIKIGIGDGSTHNTTIGIGMWLGTIMWFNVWFIIWPNQKKNIGITPATPDEIKVAARTAGLASRVNTMLSIPMLYCMAGVHFY